MCSDSRDVSAEMQAKNDVTFQSAHNRHCTVLKTEKEQYSVHPEFSPISINSTKDSVLYLINVYTI